MTLFGPEQRIRYTLEREVRLALAVMLHSMGHPYPGELVGPYVDTQTNLSEFGEGNSK